MTRELHLAAVRALGGRERVDDIKRLPRRATVARRTLPDFLVIGAQKSGTTTLYDHIAAHPSVRSAYMKEVHFFDDNYQRGLGWYRANFPWHAGSERTWLTGEASPYYILHPLAPRRAADVVPGARILAVLRNPVDRAYSHYQHERAKGTESLPFAEALDREHERIQAAWDQLANGSVERAEALKSYSYVTRGRYDEQLVRWLQHFPREQLLVIKAEDLYGKPAETMVEVFAFLGLPAVPQATYRKLNAREYDSLDPAMRQRLCDELRTSVNGLTTLLGRDFGWEL
ncbi:MAG: sulfotransferase domain-containing protein [Actinomycetes bacterium]